MHAHTHTHTHARTHTRTNARVWDPGKRWDSMRMFWKRRKLPGTTDRPETVKGAVRLIKTDPVLIRVTADFHNISFESGIYNIGFHCSSLKCLWYIILEVSLSF